MDTITQDAAMTLTWSGRAEALTEAQDWQGLLTHCHRWTLAEPFNAFAWHKLGVAYGELARHREEIEAYRKSLRLRPGYAAFWYNLGCAYSKLGRHQEAIEAYEEALRLKPDYINVWNNLDDAYSKLGRHQEEIEAPSGNRSAALVTIQDLLGHTRIKTTQRYCRVSNLKVQRDYLQAKAVVMQRIG